MHTYVEHNGGVRELSGSPEMIATIIDINAKRFTFFTSPHPIETTLEPFVITKIA